MRHSLLCDSFVKIPALFVAWLSILPPGNRHGSPMQYTVHLGSFNRNTKDLYISEQKQCDYFARQSNLYLLTVSGLQLPTGSDLQLQLLLLR